MIVTNRLLKTISTTEKRFKKRKKHRTKIDEFKSEGKYISPKQVINRLEYRGFKNNDVLFTDSITRERTIGTDDLLNINFLSKGLNSSNSVGRIRINSTKGKGYGTGFLISDNLMITNNHVLSSKDDTRNSYIEFNYQEDINSRPTNSVAFGFDPDKLFITSKKLDFTIVFVNNTSYDGKNILADFGHLKLIEEIGKLQVGEKVSIIQHPKGARKQVALRNNEVIDIFDQFVHYETDTESGSSGSPVFNEDWEVVALHHSGVPKRNRNGYILTKYGTIWNPFQGEEAINWIANEGVRISSIIKYLRLYANEKEKILLRQLLDTNDFNNNSFGNLNFGTDEDYYNSSEDKSIITNYYKGLDFNLNQDELFDRLNSLLYATHQNKLSYKPSKYVYPEVDIHKDGKLRSIYSGKEFTVEELILMDERVDLDRKAKLLELKKNNDLVLFEDYSQMLDSIEYSLPYNCEHVVPQSWFNKRNPMKGDLHHLFACETKCNSFRSNIPYYDFVDYTPTQLHEVVREKCGKKEDNKFEPEFNKGAVARATLYYLSRYPRMQEGNYDETRLETIIKWHKDNPVSQYEKHRNYKIFQIQGNRNPYIDFPDLVDKVNLKKGL